MPALKPTQFQAQILWMGRVTSNDRSELMAEPLERMELTFEGIAGSVHGGAVRASCSRVTSQYAKGTRIRNERQLSVISEEEMVQISRKMGLQVLDPARMGASIVLKGIPDFSHIPPSSRLQGPSGATLTVDMENRPCHLPARSLEVAHPGVGKGFKTAAKGLRGVTASVAAEGALQIGDVLTLHVPDQPLWAHHEAIRAN